MPATPLPFVLPEPCAVCRGPITYSGRGRRPATCSPDCRTSYRSDARTAQRGDLRASAKDALRARDFPEPRFRSTPARRGTTVPTLADLRADQRGSSGSLKGFTSESGWRKRGRNRAADPAALWLAEHAPEALADFGPDVR